MIPEVGLVLTALGILGTWFATWLARRGKREDYKIQLGNQALVELKALADGRKEEIERKDARIAALEAQRRQMAERCRKITDAAAEEIAALMHRTINPRTRQRADATLRDIEDHVVAEHDDDLPDGDDP